MVTTQMRRAVVRNELPAGWHPIIVSQMFTVVVCHLSAGHCKTGDIACRNGRCVSEYKKCDGYNDCGDGTDESECPKCESIYYIQKMVLI